MVLRAGKTFLIYIISRVKVFCKLSSEVLLEIQMAIMYNVIRILKLFPKFHKNVARKAKHNIIEIRRSH